MKRRFFIIALAALITALACSRQPASVSGNQKSQPASSNSPASANASSVDAQDAADAQEAASGDYRGGDSSAQVKSPLPLPTGHVNDYAKALDSATKQRLEERLNSLKRSGNIDFAVVTVGTTGSEDIFDYSLAVARGWRVGVKPSAGGLLLLIAINDRRWHIQVSRSLEADLTDVQTATFGRLMIDPFRAGKFGEGITKCVEAIIRHLSERRGFKLDEQPARPKAPGRRRS